MIHICIGNLTIIGSDNGLSFKISSVQGRSFCPGRDELTHWGRVTHICVSDLSSIGSDNGLSPGRRQAIIRTNAGILLIRPLGTNFSEFLVEILIFSFKKMRLKVSSAKTRPFCLGLNELMFHNQLGSCYLEEEAASADWVKLPPELRYCGCKQHQSDCVTVSHEDKIPWE